MIDFRSVREQRASSFDFIQVRIASPEEIRGPKDPKEPKDPEEPSGPSGDSTTRTSEPAGRPAEPGLRGPSSGLAVIMLAASVIP